MIEIQNKKQEMFTKALNGVLNQRGIAYDLSEMDCVYHNEDKSVCCSVGHLVKGYDMQGIVGGVDILDEAFPEAWGAIVAENELEDGAAYVGFLYDMQRIHDRAVMSTIGVATINPGDEEKFKAAFLSGMKQYAATHNLIVVLEDNDVHNAS